MNHSQVFKSRKPQTTTFKHLVLPQYQMFQNEEEKQFAQTYTKQSTIDKVNAFQFQNDHDNCRALVDCLLKDYDLWHPQTETSVFDSLKDANNQPKSSNDIIENCVDEIMEFQNDSNINETQNSNIKLKSNIIFLELENKKLQLKEKLLQKKYQKQSLEVKMAPNLEMSLRQKEKELLQIQLNLLRQMKDLSQKLEELKRPKSSSLIIDINSNKCESQCSQVQKPQKQKKKKINKVKVLNYLLQKTQTINSKEEFLKILERTEASFSGA